MKTRKSSNHQNGNGASHDVIAKAAAAQNIADAARKRFKMLKAEFKQARQAFRQAKKAARRARKEAKAATKLLKKNGAARHGQATKKTARRPHSRKIQATQRAHPRTTIPLPPAVGTPNLSAGTA